MKSKAPGLLVPRIGESFDLAIEKVAPVSRSRGRQGGVETSHNRPSAKESPVNAQSVVSAGNGRKKGASLLFCLVLSRSLRFR
ncbi:unnamed protein product [Arabis nemorensis]|uniref:Uncharacterized protein n=1 Tax=Arabis nemorensis TaxID=586526 RepID=A0A565CS49_9BRAS|nr:unnamed protein product [Arabis nemorensis]